MSKYAEYLRRLGDADGAEIGEVRERACIRCDEAMEQRWSEYSWLPTMCEECVAERKASETQFIHATRESERAAQVAFTNIPAEFQKQERSLATFVPRNEQDEKALKATHSWITDPEKYMLFLHGPNGVGKSHLIYGAFALLGAAGKKARVYRFSELLVEAANAMQDGKEAEFLQSITALEYLGLDDLGANEKRSAYSARVLSYIVDRRYRSGMPTFITSHHTLADLRMRLTPEGESEMDVVHILDRIADKTFGRIVRMEGTSHRRDGARIGGQRNG